MSLGLVKILLGSLLIIVGAVLLVYYTIRRGHEKVEAGGSLKQFSAKGPMWFVGPTVVIAAGIGIFFVPTDKEDSGRETKLADKEARRGKGSRTTSRARKQDENEATGGTGARTSLDTPSHSDRGGYQPVDTGSKDETPPPRDTGSVCARMEVTIQSVADVDSSHFLPQGGKRIRVRIRNKSTRTVALPLVSSVSFVTTDGSVVHPSRPQPPGLSGLWPLGFELPPGTRQTVAVITGPSPGEIGRVLIGDIHPSRDLLNRCTLTSK